MNNDMKQKMKKVPTDCDANGGGRGCLRELAGPRMHMLFLDRRGASSATLETSTAAQTMPGAVEGVAVLAMADGTRPDRTGTNTHKPEDERMPWRSVRACRTRAAPGACIWHSTPEPAAASAQIRFRWGARRELERGGGWTGGGGERPAGAAAARAR